MFWLSQVSIKANILKSWKVIKWHFIKFIAYIHTPSIKVSETKKTRGERINFNVIRQDQFYANKVNKNKENI
jgi:hypothetical protein